MDILKIIGVAFIVAICSIIVKTTKPELSFAINTIGAVVILLQIFNNLPQISSFFNQIALLSGIENSVI